MLRSQAHWLVAKKSNARLKAAKECNFADATLQNLNIF